MIGSKFACTDVRNTYRVTIAVCLVLIILLTTVMMNTIAAAEEEYEDGEASATFTVSKKYPPTGDKNHPALWLLLILLGTAGITLAGVCAHTEKKR